MLGTGLVFSITEEPESGYGKGKVNVKMPWPVRTDSEHNYVIR